MQGLQLFSLTINLNYNSVYIVRMTFFDSSCLHMIIGADKLMFMSDFLMS